jgi:acyl-CoA synthetase (AMP-forming)/AMP-acid ligase II
MSKPDDIVSIVEILGRRAEFEPGRLAYTFVHDDENIEDLSYGELWREVRRRAGSIARLTQPRDRVVVAQTPGLEYVISIFACLASGRIAVPTLAPRGVRARALAEAIVRDCEPALMICDDRAEGQVRAAGPRVVSGRELDADDDPPERPPEVRADDLAILQYTSGSTSDPMGVRIRHGNLLNNLRHQCRVYGVGPESRGVIWLPPYHDMGLGSGVLQPVFSGSNVVLMSPLWTMQRPLRWLRQISETRATVSGGPPFAFAACCDAVTDADLEGLDLSNWSCAFVGAEPVRLPVLDRFATLFERCGFRAEAFLPCYGLAEATLLVSAGRRGARATPHPAAGSGRQGLASCGEPLPDLDLVIVEPETCTPLPEGAEGEVWLRGPSVAAGYRGNPGATRRVFEGRLVDGRGPYLRTGDLGVLRDGELAVTGRLKDVIIFAGRKVHAADVEATVLNLDDSDLRPLAAAAFGTGSFGEERLALFVEAPGSTRSSSHEPLRRAIVAAVAQAHGLSLNPSDLVLLRRGELPRTSSGKIRRHLCRDQHLRQPAREAQTL